MTASEEINRIIEQNVFREYAFNFIPESSTRILDFGCNQGELLLRLRRDKMCRELYGIDVNEGLQYTIDKFLDGGWVMDLGLPQNDLGPEYQGFFNYIIMHDVLEHLYDPWYVLQKLRNCLSRDGKIFIVVPNLRYWYLWFQILLGRFTYGEEGGLLNEEHIRWFTLDSLRELVSMSGLKELSADLQYPPNINFQLLKQKMESPIHQMEIPPSECVTGDDKFYLNFPPHIDVRGEYLQFVTNKIVMVCRRDNREIIPQRTSIGSLSKRRSEMKEP
jgi:SAM-dependent methyltransferase